MSRIRSPRPSGDTLRDDLVRSGLFAIVAALIFVHAGGGADTIRDTTLLWQMGEAHAQMPDSRPFVTTWKTDTANQTITVPLGGDDMTIYWGDGANSTGVVGTVAHMYANPGIYEVSVYGSLDAISLDGHPDASMLVSIDQWGDISWSTMRSAFHGATNMVYTATDIPDLSRVTDMSYMFLGAASFNGDIASWDVSRVTDMSYMFWNATSFNQPLNSWDTSSVTDMSGMFWNAASFDQPLNSWDVSQVIFMSQMFLDAKSFDQPLNSWDVSSVRWIGGMFRNADSFDQPLNSWDVSQVIFMSQMFLDAKSFDQPLNSWNTSSVTDMSHMFWNAASFNHPLGIWNVSQAINMRGMFGNAASFDQPLNSWDVSQVTDMTGMFEGATSFNQPLGAWDVSQVTDMHWMFGNAASFDQPLNSWNTSSVTGMYWMFGGAASFNQPLDAWDVSRVTGMSHMFQGAASFDQPLNSWNTSSVTGMSNMFRGAASFDQPLNSWNTSSVTGMSNMFGGAASFNQPLDAWDVSQVTDMHWMFDGAASFNQPLDAWDVSQVTNMFWMFGGAASFNQPLNSWNTSSVTDMSGMFDGAASFNQPLDAWDVSQVTDMRWMFGDATSFDQPLNSWNTSSVTDMSRMFGDATSFDQPLNSWNTSSVTDMSRMFGDAASFNQPLDAWDVSQVTDMHGMFGDATSFDQPLNSWNTSSVTDMSVVFGGADSFNQPLNSWDTSSVIYMYGMFDGVASFNQPLDAWDVSQVTSMYGMFDGVASFNQPLNSWNTSSVTDMTWMFWDAVSFNQPLDAWDVSQVTDMYGMFDGAASFNQPLDAWDVSQVTDMSYMFKGATAFSQNLGHWYITLIDWAIDNDERTVGHLVAQNMELNNHSPTYKVTGAHADIFEVIDSTTLRLNYDQSVTPGTTYHINITTTTEYGFFHDTHHHVIQVTPTGPTGPFLNAPSHAFVTTWTTNAPNQSVRLPVSGTGITINWGDGHTDSDVSSTQTHTYTEPGIYAIVITGDLKRFHLDNDHSSARLSSINQWGNSSWTSMAAAFHGASHMVYRATDIPDLSSVIDMSNMFNGALSFNGDISSWDISQVTDMSGMFRNATSFDQPLDTWDTSSVTDMSDMFRNAASFDQPLDVWDVSQVTDMSHMFKNAASFDQPLDTWDTSSVTDMSDMFRNAASFNQPLGTWDVSQVTDMSHMFKNAASFDRPLGTWDVSQVTDTAGMFNGATSFNGDISFWDVSQVTDMSHMFRNAASFNQPLNVWDVSQVTNMQGMFLYAPAFNQPLNSWDTSSVTDMPYMFGNTTSFNQPLGVWDVSQVTDMQGMFWNAASFNQPLGTWDVSQVTDMSHMFRGATSFNQPLGTWDVSQVTDMSHMSEGAISFDQNLAGWYVAVGSVSIDRADVPGVVYTVSAQNHFLNGQNPTYRIEPGGDSDRFIIMDDNRLGMKSAAVNQTSYTITITASGDSIFGDGNNGQIVKVIVSDDPRDAQSGAEQVMPEPRPVSVIIDGSGGFDALDGANDVAIFGSGNRTYAIVASWDDDGVQIMDITDPASPAPVSSVFGNSGGFTTLNGSNGIEVFERGDSTYAIVTAASGDSVQIINITDPASPAPVSSAFDDSEGYDALGGANDVAIFGMDDRTYAIVAAWNDEAVQIMDITNPASPAPVSSAFGGSEGYGGLAGANDMAVFGSGNRTYVMVTAYNSDGVHIMDVTDPASPAPVWSAYDGSWWFTTLYGPHDVAVFDGEDRVYAIVTAADDDGVQIIDITNPASPSPVSAIRDGSGAFRALDGATNVEVLNSGNRTYAIVTALDDDGVQIIDVTNPASPAPVAAVFDGAVGLGGLDGANGVGIFDVGNRTYVIVTALYGDGAQIMDITYLADLAPTALDDTAEADIEPGLGQEVADLVLAALNSSEVVGAIFEDGERTYAIVTAFYDNGTQIIDITDPGSPAPVSAIFDYSGDLGALILPFDVEIFDMGGRTYAIVTSSHDGSMQIMDVTDPGSPTPVSVILDGPKVFESMPRELDAEVFESGGRTYAILAALHGNSVQIVDVTDPGSPMHVSAVFDDSVDLGDVSVLVDVDVFDVGGRTYAIVASWHDGGVYVIDITDPASPAPAHVILDRLPEMGALTLPLDMEMFEKGGSTYAIMSTYFNGASMMDITDPTNPVQIQQDGSDDFLKSPVLLLPHYVDVFESGNRTYAMITYLIGGSMIVNITDPANIAFVSTLVDHSEGVIPGDVPLFADVFESGGRTYAVTSFFIDGTRIADITDPARPVLVSGTIGLLRDR